MLESLQFHLRRFALHTGVQRCNTNALQNWSGQNSFPTALCCSARQAHSRHCVTETTPMQICSSYRCAVMQHQCSAGLVRAKCISHCSTLLCKTGLQQQLCQCNYTYGDLLCIQVCITADLYEQQIFIGVFAVTWACRQPILQSNFKQWGMHVVSIPVLQCIGFASLRIYMNRKKLQ